MAYLEHTETLEGHRALQARKQQEEIWQEEMGRSRRAINTEKIGHAGNLLSGDIANFTSRSELSALATNSQTMANDSALEVATSVSTALQNRTRALYQWSQPDLTISATMGIFAIESNLYYRMKQQNRDHFLLFGSSAQPINTLYWTGGQRTEGITPA